MSPVLAFIALLRLSSSFRSKRSSGLNEAFTIACALNKNKSTLIGHSAQKMPSLDKNRAPFFAERFVKTHVRASDPRPFGVAAMLVFKHARHDKYFFSTEVPVGIEIGLRCPSNQGGTTALLHKGHNSQPRHHPLVPTGCLRIHHFSLNLIRAQMPQFHKQSTARFTKGCLSLIHI